jgi:hypothetical protein
VIQQIRGGALLSFELHRSVKFIAAFAFLAARVALFPGLVVHPGGLSDGLGQVPQLGQGVEVPDSFGLGAVGVLHVGRPPSYPFGSVTI